ncbi:head-tail connector protein [Clostridium botulinum]|uniref:Phage gp6-like head-tail connector protein n=1 Tax=Clostridium botulinum TaxID=1491 RepID=A0A6B4JJ89_CLOBO|nr:head-tail connector protein [Clostridium botulinum]EES48805.1 conserved hypothetical protein [Clostridium botulinum E1 str. 'BoNT E Beluga']MBY6760573.1 phage gp6-like head-tail connector protein [Clostridium botulinum]MBY6919480.1 phage gp6-like head-tail connector protein [Clostridium botulinum]MCR1130358.1 head-tail connector protein [Clostridium botulinum]NFJ56887.1 phage gp6-like head-tail connector protein [Clostridium botulinum]
MDLQQVKDFLKIDYEDDDYLIQLFIEISKKYITNGFSNYDENNPTHKLFLLKAVKALYDNRDSNNDPVYLSIKLQESLGDEV